MTRRDTNFQEATLKSSQCWLDSAPGDDYRNYTHGFNGSRIKATISSSGNVTPHFQSIVFNYSS